MSSLLFMVNYDMSVEPSVLLTPELTKLAAQSFVFLTNSNILQSLAGGGETGQRGIRTVNNSLGERFDTVQFIALWLLFLDCLMAIRAGHWGI